MSLYAMIGMTPQQRQKESDVKFLGDLYEGRDKDATAELNRHIDLVEEARYDEDPRGRLFARMADLEIALEDWHHCRAAAVNVVAMR